MRFLTLLFIALMVTAIHAQDYLSYKESRGLLKEINSDIFSYFNLDEEYNTSLKKKNFNLTAEAKKLTDSLKYLKKSALQKSYSIETSGTLSEYLINRKGFYFEQDKESVKYDGYAGFPEINGFYFSNLKTMGITKQNHFLALFGSNSIYKELALYIPLNDEKVASAVEKLPVRIRINFKLTGEVKSLYYESKGPFGNPLTYTGYYPIAVAQSFEILKDNQEIYRSKLKK